jgi:hypothetical protein
MKRGKVLNIPSKDGRPCPYAFIRGEDGIDYFLHKTELFDAWDELKWILEKNKEVTIEYESTQGEKGMRAVGAQIVKHE